MRNKILFIIPYALNKAPSQRFRFEQYFPFLKKKNYSYAAHSFLHSNNWQIFYQNGHSILKVFLLIKGFFYRFIILFIVPFYDFIFIHREATPIGPPIFEWIIAKVLKKRIIYDFDDAIWLTDRENESPLLRFLKAREKVKQICKWSYKISCGNQYLCSFATVHNKNVVHNPTILDTEVRYNPALYRKATESTHVTLGWTGSHSTLKYLTSIQNVLQTTLIRHPHVRFLIIANQKPEMAVPFEFIQWNSNTEVDDLLKIDIGIMPLPDDEWSKGKCGFKAIQYLALEIPAVVSPVGVNTKIISPGISGFLCTTETEWAEALTKLILSENLRVSMGQAGRKVIEKFYSVSANESTFLSLFE